MKILAWMYISKLGNVSIFKERHQHLIYRKEIPLYGEIK